MKMRKNKGETDHGRPNNRPLVRDKKRFLLVFWSIQTNSCQGPLKKRVWCYFYSIEIGMAEMISLIPTEYWQELPFLANEYRLKRAWGSRSNRRHNRWWAADKVTSFRRSTFSGIHEGSKNSQSWAGILMGCKSNLLVVKLKFWGAPNKLIVHVDFHKILIKGNY